MIPIHRNTKYEINIEDHSGKTVPKRLMVVFNGWVVLLLSSNFFATTLCLRRVGIWAGEAGFPHGQPPILSNV